MNCRNCQAENREGAHFCGECGSKLEIVCPGCGKTNPSGDRFCDGCGLNLGTQRPDVSGGLSHPQADVSTAKPSEGERKHATVLFSDLSGYTTLSEKLDPEEVKEITARLFAGLTSVIESHGGFVEKYVGDAVMALFGVPIVHEDDPVRAVRAAREMHRLVAEMTPSLRLPDGATLSLHTGVTTGLVVTGKVSRDEGTHGVTGDTVNLASRLCNLARPGDILVGDSTYLQSKRIFSFKKLQPVSVKGKAEPVTPFKLVEEKDNATRGSVAQSLATQRIGSPLVGRNAEMVAIKTVVNRLLDGQGGILSVIGEAGLGKSRLMTEIHLSYRDENVLWLEGKTVSYGQKMSYWPFREIFWDYARITEEDSDTEAWDKFQNAVTDLLPDEGKKMLPYLAGLIGLEVRGEPGRRLRYLDGESARKQVYLASRRFFERLAGLRPLVIVFEDLHWADESTALLIEHLFPLVERVPLLICEVARPEANVLASRLRDTAVKNHERRYTEIRLSPLSPGECADLMDNLLHIENLSSRNRQLILQKADGNPFFVEEIVRTLMDRGVARRVEGHWRITSRIETMTIPDTIEGVIMARIDRLDDGLKQVLKAASVIGRTFLYRLLKEVTELSKELDSRLGMLKATELIRERQKIPELEYMFNHALVQESTYESILLRKRHELHARVAAAIESIFPERIDEFVSILAYHYAKAEQWEKAQYYLFKAGDQAGRIAADAEAVTHYQEALETYTRVFGDKWDPVQRGKLERKMGEAFYRRGEHEKAAEYFQRALTNLSRPLPASELGVFLAILREIIVQVGHRLMLFRRIERSGDQDEATEEEARVYEAQGLIYVVTSIERTLLSCLRRLNFSELHGYNRGVLTAAAFVQGSAIALGFRRVGAYYGRMAMAAAEATEDRGAIGYACTAMTLQEVVTGRLASATAYGLRAFDCLRQFGYWDSRIWAFATIFTGWWAFGLTGRYDEALKSGGELVRFGEDAGDRQSLCFGLDIVGSIQCLTGQLDEANSNLRKAIDLSEAIPDHGTRIAAGSHLGRCYIRQNNLSAGLASLRQTEDYLTRHRMTNYFASAFFRNAMAEACLYAAERDSGFERNRWLKEAAWRCKDALRDSRKYFRPLLPEALLLEGTYEWLRGKSSAAEKWWKKSLSVAEKMGMPHYSGLAHLELGKRLGERDHLRAAVAILGRINAAFDLEEARRCLDSG